MEEKIKLGDNKRSIVSSDASAELQPILEGHEDSDSGESSSSNTPREDQDSFPLNIKGDRLHSSLTQTPFDFEDTDLDLLVHIDEKDDKFNLSPRQKTQILRFKRIYRQVIRFFNYIPTFTLTQLIVNKSNLKLFKQVSK